jgi:CzcA family heavy metal efflux pump
MQKRIRTGGLAAWSIYRPISISVLSLAVIIVGLFFLERLNINLLPHIIYPEVRIRILEPGVPAQIMEDRITRQLEEQLAITEGVISTQSTTTEGRSAVNLSFAYGTDIDTALRDASTRLDRAKRFLPTTIEPPVIYKRDPSQIAVLELAVSSTEKSSTEIRDWVEYDFSKWFLNLPGVAATETGGGALREIHIIPNQDKLARLGLSLDDIATVFQKENQDIPAGRIYVDQQEFSARTMGRFTNVDDIKQLRVPLARAGEFILLSDIAQVKDSHSDERLRIRLNGNTGIKLSIQKQPEANTVEVVDHVLNRLDSLKQQNIIPGDISVQPVSDQSIFIRHALRNASYAVITGAILAMLVVYLFLGDLRGTLIIGSAIPLAIFVTFILMGFADLTLNIMTLGGLALGVGMLVDNTIVMLENITRHQQIDNRTDSAINAAREVTSPIVASTTTNLVAIIPFLFIGGLVGLLFNELIYTISAAILASLIVALTLIPALGSKASEAQRSRISVKIENSIGAITRFYSKLLDKLLNLKLRPVIVALPFLILSIFYLASGQDIFLPPIDEGKISVSVRSDPGTSIETMNSIVSNLEQLILSQADVKTAYATVGGFVFGRSTFESSTRSSIDVQLVPPSQRNLDSYQWIKKINKSIKKLELVGFKVRMRVRGIRGIRLGHGDDDIGIRIRGNDLQKLTELGEHAILLLKDVKGLSNISHSYEDIKQEMLINIDHQRAAHFGISTEHIGQSLKSALDGKIISDFIENDRQYNIRLRLPESEKSSIAALNNLLVGIKENTPVRLQDIAKIEFATAPDRIKRDSQRRMVEISASLQPDHSIQTVMSEAMQALSALKLPTGYSLYDAGMTKDLQENQQLGYILLALALFLVFVVLAVQYESLRNPFVIMTGVPFAIIGVVSGLIITDTQISMPVWLGLIMLTGLVVNHSIILIEQIEIERENGRDYLAAIKIAAQHRLRPILMTTLTTVFGMLPLALGLASGAEMLQPLAIVIVFGLLFSMIVTLLFIPLIYQAFTHK